MEVFYEKNKKKIRSEIKNKISKLETFLEGHKKVKNILLIDDDDTSNFITKETLKNYGIGEKITIYDNGIDAFNYLKSLKESGKKIPELIFLDIKMPIMDGFEFLDECKKICDIKKETKIIILSSSFYSKDKEKSLKRGIKYLTKPLQVEYIQDCLN